MENQLIYQIALILGLALFIVSIEWDKIKNMNSKKIIIILIILFFLGTALTPLLSS